MFRKSLWSIYIIFYFFNFSCQTNKKVEGSQQAVQKMKSMQIKRVTNNQIMVAVQEYGERIVVETNKIVTAKIRPNTALTICDLSNISSIDSLKKIYNTQIKLWSKKDLTNPNLTDKEKAIIDAYWYNAQNNINQSDNIQSLGDSVYIYTAPISLNHTIVKLCFSGEATPIAIWSVRFKKKDVIRKVSTKTLEK